MVSMETMSVDHHTRMKQCSRVRVSYEAIGNTETRGTRRGGEGRSTHFSVTLMPRARILLLSWAILAWACFDSGAKWDLQATGTALWTYNTRDASNPLFCNKQQANHMAKDPFGKAVQYLVPK